jgi:hypothetical protein
VKKHTKRTAVILAIIVVGAIAATLLFRAGGEPGADDPELLERLRSLGYVDHVSGDPDPTRAGVVLHDPERAFPGINVYCSIRSKQVRFLDMSGTVVHTITLPEAGDGADCLLVPTGDGDFLALAWPLLMRIGWESEGGGSAGRGTTTIWPWTARGTSTPSRRSLASWVAGARGFRFGTSRS